MAKPKPSLLDFWPTRPAATTTSRECFAVAATTIDYTLKRSKRRRSITLSINEDGLRVGAPWRASPARIESVLTSHAQWIAEKLAEWQIRRPPPFVWRSGALLMYRGEPLALDIDGSIPSTSLSGDRLRVASRLDDTAGMARQVIAWLRGEAQQWFEQRASHYAHVLGVRLPTVHLSQAKTRWGTCHPDGRVYLNWRLIQAPPAMIDYVVVHELAHLHEANHSPHFWAWVASVFPDYKDRRRALRCESHRYLVV